MSALCPDCRAEATRAAIAALDVLADPNASAPERGVAGEVATRAVETLRLPPAEVVPT